MSKFLKWLQINGNREDIMEENTGELASTEKDTLVVVSKVKNYIKSKGFMTSGDALNGLNEKIYRLIDEAIERTSANKRQTVKGSDF
jgi:hypothetical protein